MAEFQPPPLILYMENTTGEEVAVNIEPDDNFQMFLDKAKLKLGVDVDINCITKNRPVSLHDSIYQYLVNTEPSVQAELQNAQMYEQTTEFNNSRMLTSIDPAKLATNDHEYVLDDGTQIVASHIQFDNEDVILDISIEKLPFVKYKDDETDIDVDLADAITKNINITASPVAKWCNDNAPKSMTFINCLPFKPVCNNTSGFEAQFTKYLEATSKTYTTLNPVASKNKSPRSLIRDNYKKYDDVSRYDDLSNFSREEILNMFKDSPVASYEGNTFYDKRKNVRKSDPLRHHTRSKPVSYVEIDGVLIGGTECQECFICRKYVDNSVDKLYIFSNEDQKLYKSSLQNKNIQHKIICEQCLEMGFKPIKNQNQPLNKDEYLVIKNNKQYTFQKITFKEAAKRKKAKHDKDLEYVKVEIGSDGEIVTKPIDNDLSDDVIIVKDERESSDVEIIEPDLDNLEEADEDVKEFLGKYQSDNAEWKELKCRFCDRKFNEISEIIEHGDVHKHKLDDGEVYPCPLCDYGYANFKWLKGHLRAAHDKKDVPIDVDKTKDTENKDDETNPANESSPVARRTRSSAKKSDDKDSTEKPLEDNKKESQDSTKPTLMTEVKQEALDSSDEEIWILQTCDDDGDQLNKLFNTAKSVAEPKKKVSLLPRKTHKCFLCSRIFVSAEALSTHKCIKRRGRRAKMPYDKPIIPSTEDFIKRAQGRPRRNSLDEDDLLIPRNKRRRVGEPTSDPHIMTCHNCNESFTSKVRLKFHMQFHDKTSMMTKDGRYACNECERDSTIFSTETELFDHVHFQHDKLKKWQCPVKKCGKTFYLRATLTKHSRTHLDARRYVCVTCNKRFLDKQTRDEHGVTHLQIKPYQCHICMKQLTRRSRLRMHLRAHEEQLSPAHVCVCAACRAAFASAQQAQEHAEKSMECIEAFANELKEEATEVVQLSPTSGIIRQSVQLNESPKLSKRIWLQVHSPVSRPILRDLSDSARTIIRVVEIEKAFRCEYCEDVFYTEDGLNTHRVKHKGVKNPFTCHICKVSFASYSRCTTHKTTHGFYKRSLSEAKKAASEGKTKDNEAGPSATGILGYGGFPVVKHFLCEDCGRSYLHWTYLQVHRRMKHADENVLYRCNHCDQTFLNSWSVAYHKKKTHGKTGEADKGITKIIKEDHKIPCRDCDATLPNKTALYKHRRDLHMSTSEPKKDGASQCVYQCGWCGSLCGSTQLLQRHARQAHAQPPPHAAKKCVMKQSESWSCDSCGRRYSSQQDLRSHLRDKHRVRSMVIEVQGDPSNSEIMELLKLNNVSKHSAIEVTKFTFRKGTSSIIPNSIRALSKLISVPKTQVYLKADAERINSDADRCGLSTVNDLRSSTAMPLNLTSLSADPQRNPYPISLNPQDLAELNVQMLLRDGVLMNGNQMVQLQLDDNILE